MAKGIILGGNNEPRGDATENDLLNGKTATTVNGYVTGNIPSGVVTPASYRSQANHVIYAPERGYYNGSQEIYSYDANFLASNIKKDVSVYGLTGTLNETQIITAGTGYTFNATTTAGPFFNTFMAKHVEFIPKSLSGSIRISFGLAGDTGYVYNVYGQVYKNNSPVGTLRSVVSNVGGGTFAEDFNFISGDTFQIFAYTQSASPMFVSLSNIEFTCTADPYTTDIVVS